MSLPPPLGATLFLGIAVFSFSTGCAATAEAEAQHEHQAPPAGDADPAPEPDEAAPGARSGHAMPEPAPATPPPSAHGADAHGAAPVTAPGDGEPMDMGPMQGGKPPPDARDPDGYSQGYEYATDMPGLEQSDRIVFGKVLADELEFLSGNEGDGYAWSVQANYGGDRNKLWLRTQGLKVPGELDPTTSGELLWWRPYTAFWGTQLGLRQDFGAGAHTYLAAGIEGLAPYWFEVQATAYVGEDGRLAARVKASYDLRFTNRLILTPGVEANAYSRAEDERGLGAGLGNLEGGLRLRYELHRKFAPYLGYVWERSFADTADRRRAEGDPVNERRFVAGIRMWW